MVIDTQAATDIQDRDVVAALAGGFLPRVADIMPCGEMGIVFVKGPQVMKGYYNRPEKTAEMLSDDGWLNTGDLGMLTHRGELKLTGEMRNGTVLFSDIRSFTALSERLPPDEVEVLRRGGRAAHRGRQ